MAGAEQEHGHGRADSHTLVGGGKCPTCSGDVPELGQPTLLMMKEVQTRMQEDLDRKMNEKFGELTKHIQPVLDFVQVEMKSAEFKVKKESIRLKEQIDGN